MRILFLNYAKQLFQPKNEAIGDEYNRMKSYSEFIEKLDIIVFTPNCDYKAFKINEKISVIPTNGSGKLFSFLKMIILSSKICKENNIDLIQTQESYFTGLLGLYLKIIYGCKLISTAYGADIYDKNWVKENIIRHLLRIISRIVMKNSDIIQVDGTKTENNLMKHGFTKEKVYKKIVVPSEINSFITYNIVNAKENIYENKYKQIILFIGRIEKQKNVMGLISVMPDIIENIDNVLLVIIGEGREKPNVEKYVKNLKIEENVKFINNVPFEELPKYYSASDVFVLPSNYEGFARVLMLAALSAKPIVSTDVSGAKDIIEDGKSGYIVDVGDMESFKNRVIELLKDKDKCLLFGKNIKDNALKLFDYNNMIKKQIEIWETTYRN
ncbi:MAG: hypothetical protein A2252_07385 [Elusimicrobia bacterium RIFOXYA2_FULL_39_19]|nr:MAG: hypothetical protein A2252_07385 [Elusimicrobia bacterium RIFOXYA2_FULL_39_19]